MKYYLLAKIHLLMIQGLIQTLCFFCSLPFVNVEALDFQTTLFYNEYFKTFFMPLVSASHLGAVRSF